MKKIKSENVSDVSNIDALRIIAEENSEYTIDEVDHRLFELTGNLISKNKLAILWNTVLGIQEIGSSENQEEVVSSVSSESDNKENDMTKIEEVSSPENKVSLSSAIRKILSDDFEISIASIKEKCLSITGKSPSNPLIFQIKAKMKQGAKIQKSIKKITDIKKKVVSHSKFNIVELTDKVKKIKNLIEEFQGKENLIQFVSAL